MSIAALIEAVEAGTIARHDLDAFIPVLGLTTDANNALHAYRGSLDAAMALHEALLPGWTWTRWPQGDFEVRKGVGKFYAGAYFDPARAWLLAILRAKEASHDRT